MGSGSPGVSDSLGSSYLRDAYSSLPRSLASDLSDEGQANPDEADHQVLVSSKDWRDNFMPRHVLQLQHSNDPNSLPETSLQIDDASTGPPESSSLGQPDVDEEELFSAAQAVQPNRPKKLASGLDFDKVAEIQACASRLAFAVGEIKSRQLSHRCLARVHTPLFRHVDRVYLLTVSKQIAPGRSVILRPT